MAKKRSETTSTRRGGPRAEGGAKPGSKPKDGRPLPNIISMRGSPEWRAWLTRLAEKCRATPSALIDRALAELARREGFEEPPRRT
jgi:hypothetical protein